MLTNTERQQIVEEVNAGTYGIDEALDDIAAAQKGEEVRKALYAEALVLNREGHAGSTDMIARQQVANLQTSVNGQISTLRTEVGDDIDDLETALNNGLATQNGKIAAQDATIANVVANYNVEYGSTELWASTGETGALAAGTTVTLSEDVSHFDYIDIYSFCGNSNVLDTVPVDAKLQSSQGYALRWVNLSDPDSGSYKAYVRIIETRLHIIGTTLTIDHQVTYRNGEEVNISGAEITQSNRSTYMGELGIMKIVGRKITANTEIEDVRIGADGTEYASAGQAVRAQVTALESAIPAVDSTLSTQGAAADAKVAGDKVAELKSALSDKIESAIVTQTIADKSVASAVANVEDNYTISIYGTATALRRYCCYNGQNDVKVSSSDFDKTLDAGVYEITFSSSGAVDSPIIEYTYTTFNSSVILTEGTYVFNNPVMIGVRISATNYGTSESPTTITFHAKRITALDLIARADASEALTRIGVVEDDIEGINDELYAIDGKLDTKVDLLYNANSSVIPNNTNYDDITTPGAYICQSSNSAGTMINQPPENVAHRLFIAEVYSTTSLIQIALAYRKMWYRVVPNNLISVDSLVENEYVKTSGEIESYDGWSRTDYVDIGGATKLSISKSRGGNYNCFYNANKQYLESFRLNAGVTKIDVPTGAKYLIISDNTVYMQTLSVRKLTEWNRYADYKPEIPEYYTNHMLEKEAAINANIANAGFGGDSFAIVADTHWGRNTKNSPDLVKHIADHTPINRLMMLGDYYITQSTKGAAYKAMQDSLGAFKGKNMQMYIIPGNHDYNHGTLASLEILSESEVYGQIMTGQYGVVRAPDTCTFYFDNEQLKIRYYFTSCMHDSSYNFSSYKWIFRNMEDIPEGYKVIIFTHTGLSGSGARNHNYAQYLTGALKALRDKTTYTFDNEEFDYSNTDGLPIAIFSGHHHIDYVFSDNGIACIQVTTDAYYYEDSSSYNDPEIPVINREMGTVSEQAFDVATVETNSNTIYLTRIGAGRNRIIHCNKTTVSTTATLTSELAGVLTWGSTDANVATVSDGTVTKVGDGSCMISAADSSGNVEYWNIVT